MQEDGEPQETLRCRPGDLARIVYSKNPMLLGRLVIVECWNDDGRWNVHLLGEPVFGVTMYSKRPVITCAFAALDSSLIPLREQDQEDISLQQKVATFPIGLAQPASSAPE